MNHTISTHTDQLEAHIVKGRLEAEGIPVFIAFEHHVSGDWLISQAIGGVRVQVPTDYVEQAKTILAQLDTGDYHLDNHQPDKENKKHTQENTTEACPNCQSNNIHPLSRLWKLERAIMLIFSGFFLPYTQHLFRCDDCHKTWVAQEQRPYSLAMLLMIILATFLIVLAIAAIVVILTYPQLPNDSALRHML